MAMATPQRMSRALQFGSPIRQQGAIAVIAGVSLALLLGLGALVFDLARLFVVKAELQTVADSCALAAARQLSGGQGGADLLRRAEAHGLAPADPLASSLTGEPRPLLSVNRADFQSDVLPPTAVSLRFAPSIDGPWFDAASSSVTTASSARYARCEARITELPMSLMRLVGLFTTMPASASAVASLLPGQTACTFPIAMCKAAGTSASSSPPFGLVPGDWKTSLRGTGSSNVYGSGNFGWIDLSPPSGGADELAELIEGKGLCDFTTGRPVGESGVKASLTASWNSRFGLYRPGGPDAAASAGDFSGFAYNTATWPRGRDAWSAPNSGSAAVPSKNFRDSRAAFEPYQGNSQTGIKVNYSLNWTANERAQKGRDRRIVVTPIVDCSAWSGSGSGQPVVEAWACTLLLSPITNPGGGGFSTAVEFIGMANQPGSPCASSGIAGGSGASGPKVPALVQ
jgi:hypothetical protein